MVDKIKCQSEGCTAMILPTTAESTGGLCMPCKRKADEAVRNEYIRKNKRVIDPFDGATDPVEIIKIRHEPRRHDPLIHYLPFPMPPAQLYEELTDSELSRLIHYVLENLTSGDNAKLLEIIQELAAFTDADITTLQEAMLDIEEYYPGYIFRNASNKIAHILIDRLATEIEHRANALALNHILVALAWAGTRDVVSKYAEWRRKPPAWRSHLYISPESYAHCAGWELDSLSQMRKLILGKCYPLIKAQDNSDIGPVSTCTKREDTCKWCKAPLISLFAFDLSHEQLDFIPFQGRKLTIATCEVCSAFGDQLFMEAGPNGEASWYEGNKRPDYIPDDNNTRLTLTANELKLSARPRLLHHAVDWCLETTLSQVGGMPSWIQDTAHEECPKCSKGLIFVAQLAVEDVNPREEGIYYTLICPDCSITMVRYQQT